LSWIRILSPGPSDLRGYLVRSCVVGTFVCDLRGEEDTKQKRRHLHSFEVRTNCVFSFTFGKTFYFD
jgi:hypothetical protein